MNFCKFASSSIGRKMGMAFTGLFMSLFLVGHMSGNMLLLVSAEAYNKYGHAIVSNLPLLYGTEAVLSICILLHFYFAIALTLENRKARKVGYAVSTCGDKSTSLACKTMIQSGMVILLFIIIHLKGFKFGPHYEVTYDGVVMRDLYTLVKESFQTNLAYAGIYIFAVLVLGVHLSHGIQSSFQSLGINHPRYTPYIKKVGCIMAAVISLGFCAQPLFFILGGGNS